MFSQWKWGVTFAMHLTFLRTQVNRCTCVCVCVLLSNFPSLSIYTHFSTQSDLFFQFNVLPSRESVPILYGDFGASLLLCELIQNIRYSISFHQRNSFARVVFCCCCHFIIWTSHLLSILVFHLCVFVLKSNERKENTTQIWRDNIKWWKRFTRHKNIE